MMPTGSFFPWPILIIPAVMFLAMVFFMAQKFSPSQDRIGFGCGHNTHRHVDRLPAQRAPFEDPILILRERFARGELPMDEFKLQLEELLRSEQSERMSWNSK